MSVPVRNNERFFLIVLLPGVERSLKEKGISDLEDRMHKALPIRLYKLKKNSQVALWVDDDITLLLKKQQCYFLCVHIAKFPTPSTFLSHYHELPRIKPYIIARKNICRYKESAADCDSINREVMEKEIWNPFASRDSMKKKWEAYLKLRGEDLEYKRFHLPVRGCNIDVFPRTSETISVPVTGNGDDVIEKIKASHRERLGFILKMPHGNLDDDSPRGMRKGVFGKMKSFNGQFMKVDLDERFNESVQQEVRSGIDEGKFPSIRFFSPKQNAKGKTIPGQQDVNLNALIGRSTNCNVATKSAEVKFEDTPDAKGVHFYYDNEMKVPAFSCLASRSSSGWCITPDSIKLCNFMVYADCVSDIYQSNVMKRSLNKITSLNIWKVLSGERPSRIPKAVDNIEWTKNLNQNQKAAVEKALGAQELCLIWGPPGTGKTEVIAEIARQQSIRGKKTLIASQANLAVDNALGRLYDVSSDNMFALRIVNDDYDMEDDDKEKIPTWENCGYFFSKYLCARIKAQKLNADPIVVKLRQKMLKRLESATKSSNRVEREMVQMAELYQKRISVAGSTLMRAGKAYKDGEIWKNKIRQQMNMKEDEKFDTVIIDEVSKALPTELIIPILLGKSVVLVGDHKQLPPMLEMRNGDHLSLKTWSEASGIDKEELDTDYMLFEDLWKGHHENASSALVMLTKQYRMHPEIQEIIQDFYPEEEGIDATLECGLTEEEMAKMTVTWSEPLANVHVAWVGTNSNANESKDGTSFCNHDEIRIIGSILKLLPNVFPDGSDLSVGVITFYGAQRDILKNRYQFEFSEKFPKGLIFGTVDRFQGRECDVVLCSLVRKNDNNDIGFAKKSNRINVAFSRARCLLCIVGNRGHFCHETNDATAREIYRKIFRQCEQLREEDIDRVLRGESS